MILPDFVLSSRANQCWHTSGLDSLEHCLDPKHFKKYPHAVTYQYNSRGFRDCEWPSDQEQLQNAIWCVGDSFTVGIGSPIEHCWPRILQQQFGTRTINVSMDGASNDWIARKSVAILQQIQPSALIIHWSYLHRREITREEIFHKHGDQSLKEIYSMFKKTDWPDCDTVAEFYNLPMEIQQEVLPHWVPPEYTDEERRRQEITDLVNDLENIKNNVSQVLKNNKNTKIIHSFVPNFADHDTAQDLQAIIDQLCKEFDIDIVDYFSNLDYARDRHHYDKKTADYFVQQLLNFLV